MTALEKIRVAHRMMLGGREGRLKEGGREGGRREDQTGRQTDRQCTRSYIHVLDLWLLCSPGLHHSLL